LAPANERSLDAALVLGAYCRWEAWLLVPPLLLSLLLLLLLLKLLLLWHLHHPFNSGQELLIAALPRLLLNNLARLFGPPPPHLVSKYLFSCKPESPLIVVKEGTQGSLTALFKEVLRRENQGLKICPVDGF
jgi:hypothetical protein